MITKSGVLAQYASVGTEFPSYFEDICCDTLPLGVYIVVTDFTHFSHIVPHKLQ